MSDNRLSSKKNWLVGLLSGILLILAFPPFSLSILAFVALIPLLIALDSELKKKYTLIYFTFLIFHIGTLWWVGSWQKNADPYLMLAGSVLCLAHPFFFLIPFMVYFNIKKKLGQGYALYLFPFVWLAFEYLKSLGDLAFPWLSLGYTSVNLTHWVQIADIGGIWLVSFLIVLTNILVYKYILNVRQYNLFGIKELLVNSHVRNIVVGILLIIVVPNVYGFIRIPQFSDSALKDDDRIDIALVQANIDPWDKWSTDAFDQIALHVKLQNQFLNENPKPDMFVWSETAIPYCNIDVNSRPYRLDFLREYLDRYNISLLTGFSEIYFFGKKDNAPVTAKPFRGDSLQYYQAYNSAIMINSRDSSMPDIYRKMKLTPFSERLPYVDIISFAAGWFEWNVGISNWGKGWEQKTVTLKKNNTRIAPIICIESLHPDFIADFAKLGAQIFIIITNDSWFNHTFGPEQHFNIARMRAIENKRFVARCANSGISGFISPIGTILKTAPSYKQTVCDLSIPKVNILTLYSRINGIFAEAIFYCVIALIAYVNIRYRKNSASGNKLISKI